MELSARNTLKGKVKQLSPGAVNTEVTVELPGGAEVVSIITKGIGRATETCRWQRRVCCHQSQRRDDRHRLMLPAYHPPVCR